MASERIVVIDDDPDFREALCMILEPVGYRLDCYATGPDGLAAVRADPPDLVLLDVMLSSPSEGLYVARDLRRYPASRRVPIIMITSYRGTLGADYAREFGDDYIPPEKFLDKPITAEAVRRAVQETLAATRVRQS